LFFDRDARYFLPVLNFLRHGKFIIENDISVEGVLEEAKYFGVKPLETLILDRLQPRPEPDLIRRQIIRICSESDRRSFRGLVLDGVDFSLLDLMGANFCKSSLRGCKFDGADLIHARFQDANLENASFKEASLPYAQFQNANLRCVDFSDANVHGSRFQGACLAGAKFPGANVNKTKFHDADMEGVENIVIADLGIVGKPDYTGSVPMPILSVTDHDPGYLTD